jgi:streptogrisin D
MSVLTRYVKRKSGITIAVVLVASAALAIPSAQAVSHRTGTNRSATIDGYSSTVERIATATLSSRLGINRDRALNRLAHQQAQRALDAQLVRRLGSRSASSWINPTSGALTVNVLDERAAATVRAAGAVPRRVTHTSAALRGVTTSLNRLPTASGTAWYVDPVANRVQIVLSASAKGRAVTALRAAARRYGSMVSLTTTSAARFAVTAVGGEAIYSSTGFRCSAGFNVRSSSDTPYLITAGHCTNGLPSYRTGSISGTVLGASVDSEFPGDDFGAIRNSSGIAPTPGVALYDGTMQPISSASNAIAGETVCKSGSTTGLTCGSVLGTNVTVNYAQGRVYGLVETNVCVDSGDSGGSLFSGSAAIGLTSGGSQPACQTGSLSFFQPMTEVLSTYGVSLE